jgi:S-adenosylmethionine/arginine decarboxylase-like enzyme
MSLFGISSHYNIEIKESLRDDEVSRLILLSFLRGLIIKINMKAFGDPHLIFFGAEPYTGWSCVQLIETSNITFHTQEHKIYLDVFSCGSYDVNKVLEYIHEFFVVMSVSVSIVERK